MLRGTSSVTDAIAKVVRYCHGPHGLYYDSEGGGGSQYNVSRSGGAFDLSGYMVRSKRFANCYDQAAALQALCGAAGIKLSWIYMQPYGFIRRTSLLGYGLCNNPFFRMPAFRAEKLVPLNDPRRTPFGNHAFCGYGGKVLDACAGPHIGNENPEEYVDRSVDSTPSLYPNRFMSRPGTVADMYDSFLGVTSVT
jgi:hypothetical protein